MKLDDELKELLNGAGILENIIPSLQYVWETQKMKELKSITKQLVHDFIGGKFREHQKSFDRGACSVFGNCSRIPVARTLMARLPWLLRTRFKSLTENPIAVDIIVFEIFSGDFLFAIDNGWLCVLLRIAFMRRF